jgi:4-amino-4-deoxy-L-arabinose transferase-like glycosyltransferase
MALTLLLAAFLLLPSMASVGMFLDGVIYAAISRNLAAGLGSAWAPHFSQGLFDVFREHPPLVFWLQSLFFRALGDSYLTERAYDLAVLTATVLLLRTLWRQAVRAGDRPGLAGYWWLALLCWVLVPKWSWAYRSNVLENTMALWCLAAVVAVLAALDARSTGRAVGFAALAGAATLAGFLSKGLPALFVLPAALLLLAISVRFGPRRALGAAAVQALFAASAFAALLWLAPEARAYFIDWWQHQVAARTGLSSGWAIVPELAKKLAPMAAVLLVSWTEVRNRLAAGWWRGVAGPAASMLALGLGASLPLVLGDRDSGHYLLPSLPFFALGFGLAAAALLDAGGRRTGAGLARPPGAPFVVVASLAALAIAAMSGMRIGEVRKNEPYHELFERVAAVTGPGAVIGVERSLYDDWMLHAVAQRYYRIALDPSAVASWQLGCAAVDGPGGAIVESGPWALRELFR